MKVCCAVLIGMAVGLTARAEDIVDTKVPAALNFKMKTLDGKDVDLAKYKGKVVMFVNVASKCGYTPSTRACRPCTRSTKPRASPSSACPPTTSAARSPVRTSRSRNSALKYGVKFDMLSKVSVKGEDITPLYKHLTSKETDPKFAGDVKWNFEKFLISKDGQVVGRYGSKTKPDDKEFVAAIERELAK